MTDPDDFDLLRGIADLGWLVVVAVAGDKVATTVIQSWALPAAAEAEALKWTLQGLTCAYFCVLTVMAAANWCALYDITAANGGATPP